MYYNNYYPNVHPQYTSYPYKQNSYIQYPHYYDERSYPSYPDYQSMDRQASIRGQATWTDGGPVTKCEIPWSLNQYMTVAVGENTPYRCGDTLQVRNLRIPGQRPISVTVVDKVIDYPINKINLHRRAFRALGAELEEGVINVEITPVVEPDNDNDWVRYLLNVLQTAYPNYHVTEYQSVETEQISPEKIRETYRVNLRSPEEQLTVKGTIQYNPQTNRLLSFDVTEE